MIDIIPNSPVLDCVEKDEILYLGGQFMRINNIQRYYCASIDLTTGTLTNFMPFFGGYVKTICVGTNKIAFGGSFTSVSYNGNYLGDLNGFVIYNTSTDTFEKPNIIGTGISKSSSYSYPVSINKILYHASTSTFYVCGNFLIDFSNIQGIESTNVTGAFGVVENDNNDLVDVGFRYNSSQYINCVNIAIGSDILYLSCVVNPSNSTSLAFNISSNLNITPYTAWYPWSSSAGGGGSKIFYIDGKIWTFGISSPLQRYRENSSSVISTVNGVAIASAVDGTIINPTNSGIWTYSNYGSMAVNKMWEDTNYIYILGKFWGFGPTSEKNLNSGVAKISKATYLPVGQRYDLRYMSYTGFMDVGNVNASFTYDGKTYLFGTIPQVDGFVKTSQFGTPQYTPLIINEDFSKLQNTFLAI